LVLVILLIAVLIGISIVVSTVFLASYSALEEQYIAKDLNPAVNRLDDERFSMSPVISDWGPRDTTVEFANGRDPNYLKSNLQPHASYNFNLNLIVITGTEGEVIFPVACDLKNKVTVPIRAFFSG